MSIKAFKTAVLYLALWRRIKKSRVSFRKGVFNSKYDNGLYKYPICHGKERTEHPTQKPLSLLEYLVSTYSNENDIVLDNCMGSNTTGLACQRLNRQFIGIEKEKAYYDISVKRLSETLF